MSTTMAKTAWGLKLWMALWMVVPAVAAGQEPLFPDKDLEDVVRQSVFEKRNNQEPLTEKDVENISTIKGRGKRITNLKGLEKCRSLLELDLSDNAISDVAPLAELKGLQSLSLAKNKIQDARPLAGLVNLQYLELSDNRVADLSPLKDMKAMRSLYLSNNQIADLKPIEDLIKLWSLYLDGNNVADLTPLAKLTRLTSLDLRYNEVADLAALAGYTELKHLMLDGNKITDLGVLVAMCVKDAEGEKNFAPFLNLYLSFNPLSEAAKTQQLQELKRVCREVKIEE